jgi:hypothetical protein
MELQEQHMLRFLYYPVFRQLNNNMYLTDQLTFWARA